MAIPAAFSRLGILLSWLRRGCEAKPYRRLSTLLVRNCASTTGSERSQTPSETLGGGWVAKEALAIAICCALSAPNFQDGIILAANHSGDSDNTAAIAGNLLGVQLGEQAIPHGWLIELELRSDIGQVADDLYAVTTGKLTADAAWERYPGW
jgi:ADP-ribosylglycohydrolase